MPVVIIFLLNCSSKLLSPLGSDVTGGMLHKVGESLKLAELGIKSIINGVSQKNLLRDALLGKQVSGTAIY